MPESIVTIAQQLADAYRTEHKNVLSDLENSRDELEREELSVAKAAFETVIRELNRIRDVTTALQASEALVKAIRGMQSAVRFQIIDHAREAIADQILGPVRVPIDPTTAKKSAIAFLRQEINSTARQAILADIDHQGLERWAVRNHMPFGMGIRNRLREVGYDEVWGDLVYEAVREQR